MQSVGKQIKVLRQNAGMTQKELSQKLGKSESAVRMWELEKSIPDIDTLRKLSAIFNTQIVLTPDYVDMLGQKSNGSDNEKTPPTDREREIHFLRAYSVMELNALEIAAKVFDSERIFYEEGFPVTKEQLEMAVTDLLEVLFWRCGGIRELFFTNREYRQERMRRGNSPDMMTLAIAEELERLISEIL